ncbi:MAG: sensor histidine kinase KdpD [Actinobacteria bacterium]|nr:sensor histidine kinase KdpD [Actinomycetota bacterium]
MGDEPPPRGALRVYLGAAPGVGKTYAMLDEGRRRAARGTDVVVGLVETHGRTRTAELLEGLELLPRRQVEHRGTTIEELDVDAVLARAPEVVLVDELAHTDAPGSRHTKRWQDIDELLAAGIDVISTVNIQHLESVNDVVEQITGVRQQETVPDAWVRTAEQIQLVDMTPEALRRRMAHGNVYPADRIDAALGNYFRVGNLGALRELALLWVADRVEDELQTYLASHGVPGSWETRERVLVALTGAPGADNVIRRAARLARRNQGELIGVHISPTDGLLDSRGPELSPHRQILEELGGTYREVVGDDIADTLAAVARSERVTQIVIGASRRSRRQELTGGSVVNDLLRHARDLDIHVISAVAAGESPPSTNFRAAARLRTPLPRRRRAAAWLLLLVGAPLLFLLLIPWRDSVGVPTVMLLTLTLVVAVGTVGGRLPGVVAAITCSVAINFLFVPPIGTLTVTQPENVIALLVFVIVGATVARLVDRVARRSAESNQARADADALARSAAILATDADPFPSMLAEVRSSLGLEAVALLHESAPEDRERTGGAPRWQVVASSGDRPPRSPGDGAARTVSEDGRWMLVLRGDLGREGVELLETLAGQLGVAVEAHHLRQEATLAEALLRADELRTGILQAVSHDLRTPLAAIKASVTSLLSPDMEFGPDDTREFLVLIDDEVDRLDRVVGNLLDMSRLQSGGLRVLRGPTPVEDVVSAAVDAVDSRTCPRVEMRIPAGLPPLDVDPALAERALANVIANALAVQPDDLPVVVDATRVGGEVHIRVIDRGPGIRAGERERIRAPFQRLGDRSQHAGVGLGLAIADGFTVANGGHLELDDTAGGGLTAVFELPTTHPEPDRGGPP